jgi:hypothetical protein
MLVIVPADLRAATFDQLMKSMDLLLLTSGVS